MSIARVDRNGTPLTDGDIVAECTLGEVIWNGEAKVVQRPLGIVTVYHKPLLKCATMPEETDFYNVQEIRPGRVELDDNAREFLRKNADKHGFMGLHLSRYDGKFYAWDNIEIVGSVYDFPY